MAMIAAVAFLAVPAAMYMANPEFTCSENETEPEINYHSESEEEEEVKKADSSDNVEKEKPDDGDDKPKVKVQQSKSHNDRLLKAAEDVFGPPNVRSLAPPVSSAPRKREDVYKREHESAAVAPTVAKYAAPVTPERVPAQRAEAAPVPYTPTSPVPIMPADSENGFDKTTPRRESGSSAYRQRLSHLQQQQAIFQQHQEVLQSARSLSPQKHMPNRDVDASKDKPAPVANGRAAAPRERPSTTSTSATDNAHLPPLPPKTQVSPVRSSINKPAASTPAVSDKTTAALLNSEPYLTPRAKQQKALAELRRQEEEQRNLTHSLIQDELSRAMEDLHAQEALQKKEDEHQRHLLEEEHRRREAIQKTLQEEKQRIHREEEQRRLERRRLQDEAEEQRLADQRAIANVLIEVENERVAEEKRLQEELMNRVERQLKSEEQRQHEILEQLRLQNQYPYPRTHSSAILTALAGGSNPENKSPSQSPSVSPNSSFRVPNGAAAEKVSAPASPSAAEATTTAPARPNTSNRLSTGSTQSNVSTSPSKPSAIPVRAERSTSRTEEAARLRAERAEQQRIIEQRLEERRNSHGSQSSNREAHHESLHQRESVEHKEHLQATEHHLSHHHTEHATSKRVESITVEETLYETVKMTTTGNARNTSAQRARVSPRTSPVPSRASNPPLTPHSTTSSNQHTPKSAGTPHSNGSTPFTSHSSEVSDLDDEDEISEHRVLHARDELALQLDGYIRSQKKFCSAAPLKYKCPVSKIITDCEKFRKSYNLTVHEEVFKVHNLLHFMEKNPRFAVSGGRQMVGVTHLTPFQSSDTRRVFGNFKCSKCVKYWMENGVNKSDFREWSNAYSYKDCFQTCYQCDLKVYPYTQRALKKTELHFDDRAKHDVNRCSRCEALHKPCYEFEV